MLTTADFLRLVISVEAVSVSVAKD